MIDGPEQIHRRVGLEHDLSLPGVQMRGADSAQLPRLIPGGVKIVQHYALIAGQSSSPALWQVAAGGGAEYFDRKRILCRDREGSESPLAVQGGTRFSASGAAANRRGRHAGTILIDLTNARAPSPRAGGMVLSPNCWPTWAAAVCIAGRLASRSDRTEIGISPT